MKRISILIVIFMGVAQISMARSLEDKRRIEEEKRKDLLSSEFYLVEKQEVHPRVVIPNQNIYFSKLLSKEVAVLSDAYKTLVILMGVDDQFIDFDSQFNFLKEKGIIPKNIGVRPNDDEPLRKGIAAYMFAKAMDVKGGITLRLFGLSQRYAFKELVYQGIMSPGDVEEVMSGQELILTLTQAADYMADKQKDLR